MERKKSPSTSGKFSTCSGIPGVLIELGKPYYYWRRCSHCRKVKRLKDFYWRPPPKDYPRQHCKQCWALLAKTKWRPRGLKPKPEKPLEKLLDLVHDMLYGERYRNRRHKHSSCQR